MAAETLYSFFALALGFALAGLVASAYQVVAQRPISFRLLNGGPSAATLAAVPLLVVAAPFIILRNAIRGRRIEGRRFQFTMAATILSGLWSLMSGSVGHRVRASARRLTRACGVARRRRDPVHEKGCGRPGGAGRTRPVWGRGGMGT